MSWPRRVARVGGWALLAVAAASLLLGGVSLIGVSWSAQRGEGADLIRGRLEVRYRGAQGRMKGRPAGWMVGDDGKSVAVSGAGTSWIRNQSWSFWFGRITPIRGWGGGAGGAAPVGPGWILAVFVRVDLLRVAGLAAAAGGILWFATRRRPRPDACRACDYDLAGLAPGSACPECGMAT